VKKMSRQQVVAFIGLGAMGLPMATNLARDGVEVHGYDLNRSAEATLARAGGHVGYPSVASACKEADAVILMLPGPEQVRQSTTGAEGVLQGLQAGGVVIDMSTCNPRLERELGEAVRDAGHAMVDAPVSGGTVGAESGKLTVMVGADAEVFERVKPLLEIVGSYVIHVGQLGDGQAVKLVNNLVSGITMAAVSEAYALAERAELDPAVLFKVMSTSSADCWSLRTRVPVAGLVPSSPVEDGFRGGFAARLMCKDLDLVREFASDVDSPILLGGLVRELYSSAKAKGLGDLDYSVVAQVYNALSSDA
jgi:3-hydroxyisobutyrate dehydrogenase